MRKHKRIGKNKIISMAVLLCLLSLAGCSPGGTEQEDGRKLSAETDTLIGQEGKGNVAELINVGFSQLGSESVWRSANTVSMQEALTTQNGYFLIYSNARQKQENQIKAIRSFISQRVDYIVFSPVTEDGWDTVLQEAADAKIPVITSDRQVNVADADLVTAWVGGDMFEEGRKAGLWLKEHVSASQPLNIVVLTGTEGSSAALGRTEGFHSVADEIDNWMILEEKSGDFTMARGKEIMEYYLETYPQIDVLVSQNDDMTFGAVEAMEKQGIIPGKDILILSFDAVKQALEMVQEGKINVDVECSPLLGPYVDELIKALEHGDEIGRDHPVDEMVFTADNVADYIEGREY